MLPNNTDQSALIENLLERIHSLETTVTAIGYDAKASKKRRFISKRQANTLQTITRALCVETIDPRKQNRIRFYHPLLHDPKTPLFTLPFASPCSAMGGFDDCGLSWVPPAGSTVYLFHESGQREAPIYLGTGWHKDRGPNGQDLLNVYPSREYQNIYQGHRKGYLIGPDDESQVSPPWNNESYNGADLDDQSYFTEDPQEQIRTTYPNIYGFKTPEKHMLKMVDGNAKCNRRGKRIEILSGCGNSMIFKDDHLHYAGQFVHPSCGVSPGGQSLDICSIHSDDQPFFTDVQGKPIEGDASCSGKVQSSKILGGHSSTPNDPPDDPTKYPDAQTGSNKFFAYKNECRPYSGPGTPQNNKIQLPQSGIQFLSISGHTIVLDDSVEEPRGKPEWERSMEPHDFGCNDKCLGVMFLKSSTGHALVLSDVEQDSQLRGKSNYAQLRTASGNKIELNDETIGQKDCPGSPPNLAGPNRGIHLQSTSNHQINMVDHLNQQSSPCRKEGGIPVAKATRAFMQFRSGYGCELRFNDDFSQEQTQQQWVQLLNPQCVDANTDDQCNSCDTCDCRGPHLLRLQARPKGTPGVVFLRAGGHSIRQSYDMDIVIVGDKDCNPSDKFTYVSKRHIRATEDMDFRYTGDSHVFFAENQILLMAGRDCPPQESGGCAGPCLYSVIVSRAPQICPLTGFVHWTEKAASERVFASGKHACQIGASSDCGSYEAGMASAGVFPDCQKQSSQNQIDTGAGVVNL